MGWTTGPRPRNVTEWLRQQYTWETDDKFYRPLETAVVAFTEAYVAVEIVDKVTREREVGAATMEIRFTRDSYEQFGYKCVDETSGPIIRRAPRKILELLTPTDNENAQNWRADCWARLERREQNRLAKGELVELDEPMRFTNDQEYTLFKLQDARRNIFSAVNPETGFEAGRVRISNWRDRRFTRLQGRRLAELKDIWKENKTMKEQQQSFADRFLEQVDRMFDGAPAKANTQRPFETWTRAEVDSEIARLRPLVPAKGTGVDEVTWFELQNVVGDLNDEDAALYVKKLDHAMPAEPYLSKMLTIAVEAHRGQTDRGGAPYVLHPMEVVAILREKFPDADDELLAQAMGHDIIEDTGETRETLLQKGMTERIVDGIEGVSKDPEKRESMDGYKARVFASEDRMKVKLSDLTHNSDLSRLKKVRDKDVERQSRYLQFAAEIEDRLGLTTAPTL